MLTQLPQKRIRRAPGQTDRKKLAGPKSRNRLRSLDSRPYPPAKAAKALKKLGKRIRALRTKKGLTQVQLARGCGISALQLERIETGRVNLALSSLVRLARKLHITMGETLRGIK